MVWSPRAALQLAAHVYAGGNMLLKSRAGSVRLKDRSEPRRPVPNAPLLRKPTYGLLSSFPPLDFVEGLALALGLGIFLLLRLLLTCPSLGGSRASGCLTFTFGKGGLTTYVQYPVNTCMSGDNPGTLNLVFTGMIGDKQNINRVEPCFIVCGLFFGLSNMYFNPLCLLRSRHLVLKKSRNLQRLPTITQLVPHREIQTMTVRMLSPFSASMPRHTLG